VTLDIISTKFTSITARADIVHYISLKLPFTHSQVGTSHTKALPTIAAAPASPAATPDSGSASSSGSGDVAQDDVTTDVAASGESHLSQSVELHRTESTVPGLNYNDSGAVSASDQHQTDKVCNKYRYC
jgi:hypothetical protein